MRVSQVAPRLHVMVSDQKASMLHRFFLVHTRLLFILRLSFHPIVTLREFFERFQTRVRVTYDATWVVELCRVGAGQVID